MGGWIPPFCPGMHGSARALVPVCAGPDKTWDAPEVRGTGRMNAADANRTNGGLPHNGAVLVVDDALENRQLLLRLLTGDGYCVESVADGEAALAAIDRNVPDLILLDVQLPGIDGFE